MEATMEVRKDRKGVVSAAKAKRGTVQPEMPAPVSRLKDLMPFWMSSEEGAPP